MNKTQFKPGQSGNPAGRPKGTRNKSVLVQAQRLADSEAVNVVRMYKAIIAHDVEHLASIGIDASSIRPSHKLAAAEKLQKFFSNGVKTLEDEQSSEQKKPVTPAPVFQTHAGKVRVV